MKFLKDILTGKDNKTYDIGRFAFLFTILYYSIIGAISIFSNKDFSCLNWAYGISAIIAAFGAHFYLKKDTEPDGR